MADTIHGALSNKKFSDAAIDVLKFLNRTLDFDLWVITRLNGDEYIVLESEDHGYNTPAGSVFKWCDTFCSRMIAGEGPNFAANLESMTAYRDAPFTKVAKVGAYMGVPIKKLDGSLFGTLCAIHPTEKDESLHAQLPMVETFAALLSNILSTELEAMEGQRRAEHAEAEAMKDTVAPMLYNHRGWMHLTRAEDERSRKFGHNMAVISIDLDGLKQINDTHGHEKGSAYIAKAGQAIHDVCRPQDVIARTGGDEFFILLPESDMKAAYEIIVRIKDKFKEQAIEASIGVAQFDHSETLANLIDRADKDMYIDKRARKAAH